MIQQDYILRMIEQLARVLAKILFNKETKNYQEAEFEADKALLALTGLDFNFIKYLSSFDIIRLLEFSADKESAKVKALIAGKLIKEKLDLKILTGDDKEISSKYLAALGLLLEGLPFINSKDFDKDNYLQDIKQIVNRLNNSEIPAELKEKLNMLSLN